MKNHRAGSGSRKRAGIYPPRQPHDLPPLYLMDTIQTDGSTSRRRIPPELNIDHIVQRYSDLYDFAPNGYVSFDRSGRIAEINLTAAQLFGLPRERIIGMPFVVFVSRDDTTLFLHHLLQCRRSEARVATELRLKDAKGKIIYAELSSTPVAPSLHNGALVYQTAIIDLTERKRADQALREKEAELEQIVTQTPFMLTRCSRDLRYLYVSPAYAKMLGRKPEKIAGKPIVAIIGKEGLKTALPHIKKVLKGHRVDYETEISYPSVGARCVHCVYTPDRDSNGSVIGWFASINDVTRRQRAEAALRRSKDGLKTLVRQRTEELLLANAELKSEIERRKGLEGQILEVSDREQQRLGQELHDGLCQHLTAVAFMARSVALRLRNHRVVDVQDIERIAVLVNEAATDTRNLSRALHRIDVDAAGFLASLQDLVDREIWKVPCRLEAKPSFRIQDDMTAVQLYRIAREAVINANKHAQAREIVIKLERSRRGMALRVIDDGVGFSNVPKLKQGLGFQIMNYRAQLAGGRLEIESPKGGGGTCVSCYLPNHTLRPLKSQKKANDKATRLPEKIAKVLTALI